MLVTYLAIRLITTDEWTPVVAASFVALLPRMVFLSSFVTNDNLVNLLGAVLTFLALRYALNPNRWRMAAVGAVFGLLVTTKLTTLPVALVIPVLACLYQGGGVEAASSEWVPSRRWSSAVGTSSRILSAMAIHWRPDLGHIRALLSGQKPQYPTLWLTRLNWRSFSPTTDRGNILVSIGLESVPVVLAGHVVVHARFCRDACRFDPLPCEGQHTGDVGVIAVGAFLCVWVEGFPQTVWLTRSTYYARYAFVGKSPPSPAWSA